MPPRALDRMMTSVAQTGPALQDAQTRGVRAAALEATTLIRAEIRKASGGDMRLSGAARNGKGAKVGAGFDIKGTTNPSALIRAYGPIQLIERDTAPHLIMARSRFVIRGGVRVRQGRRSAAGRRLRGKAALTIGGGFYASAQHPGTKGKRPFAKGAERAAPLTPRLFQAEIDKGLRKAWSV